MIKNIFLFWKKLFFCSIYRKKILKNKQNKNEEKTICTKKTQNTYLKDRKQMMKWKKVHKKIHLHNEIHIIGENENIFVFCKKLMTNGKDAVKD